MLSDRHRKNIEAMVASLPDDAPYHYLVIGNAEAAIHAKKEIKRSKPQLTPSVRIVDCYSLHLLYGLDPLLIHIDEFIFDSCTSRQMAQLHKIVEDGERVFQ